jgi:DMSO/TMAO reductase YedYZ molybdopterin-dependent catalytic subunit
MKQRELPRRTVLKGGAAGLAGLSVVAMSGPAAAFPGSDERDVVIPWLDQPAPIPVPAQGIAGNLLVWEDLDSWHTPNEKFFTIKHYNLPALSAVDHRLSVEGLVANPRTFSLADLRQLPRTSLDFTLECSGNHGLPFLTGAVGNARWGGTSLRRLLRQARPLDDAVEVVFWGADAGTVTIKDDSGVTGGGLTGVVKEGTSELTITEHFARSMTLEDAMSPDNLLCYEMNGQSLPTEHGHPVRLIAPGWYGVANVKWLSRIQVTDRRYEGRFMARDYVTIRETKQAGNAGNTVWTFTSVAQDRLKSAPAKVVRRGHDYSVLGAAWGAPIARVEVQVDGGPWHAARLQRHRSRGGGGFSWDFWSWQWPGATAGEHTITSRAYDEQGTVQPAPTDDSVTNRRTYWEANGQISRRVRI